MTTERKLHDAVMLDLFWSTAAYELLINSLTIVGQVQNYGELLADRVVIGQLNVADLRAGTIYANALDQEAVAIGGARLNYGHTSDRIEAIARRIAHHSGRVALSQVKSAKKRTEWSASYGQRHQLRQYDAHQPFKNA